MNENSNLLKFIIKYLICILLCVACVYIQCFNENIGIKYADGYNDTMYIFFDNGDGIDPNEASNSAITNKVALCSINNDFLKNLNEKSLLRIDPVNISRYDDINIEEIYLSGGIFKNVRLNTNQFVKNIEVLECSVSVEGNAMKICPTSTDCKLILKYEYIKKIYDEVKKNNIYISVLCCILIIFIFVFLNKISWCLHWLVEKLGKLIDFIRLDKKTIKGKKWNVIVISMFLVGLFIFMTINYIVDPYGHFVEKTEYNQNQNGYHKYDRVKYILNNKEKYEGFIIGGSNAGALSPKLFREYTGVDFYNFNMPSGNFSDYKTYSEFLIDNTNVKYIVLHLSSSEVMNSSYHDGESSRPPAVVSGDKYGEIKENINALLLDVDDSVYKLKNGDVANARYTYYDGRVNWDDNLMEMESDWDEMVNNKVLSHDDSGMKSLFSCTPQMPALDDNVKALKDIKKLCDDNNIELIVVQGSVFLPRRYQFEDDEYYDYLKELVCVTDIYDFSDFNEYNRNPYNFLDMYHYSFDVGDEMIKYIYGDCKLDDFGTKLTMSNIDNYIANRKEKYNKLKEEYDETGTVKYEGYDDDSRITRDDMPERMLDR